MRLWLPQLFASIREYEQLVENNEIQSSSTSICAIIDYSVNRTKSQLAMALDTDSDTQCTVNVSPASYTNNIIVAAAGLVAYMLAGFLVNLVGFKRIMSKCSDSIWFETGIELWPWTCSHWSLHRRLVCHRHVLVQLRGHDCRTRLHVRHHGQHFVHFGDKRLTQHVSHCAAVSVYIFYKYLYIDRQVSVLTRRAIGRCTEINLSFN